MNLKNIPVGTTGRLSIEVTRALTAAHSLPHLPEVYSTPNMIALISWIPSSKVFVRSRRFHHDWQSIIFESISSSIQIKSLYTRSKLINKRKESHPKIYFFPKGSMNFFN